MATQGTSSGRGDTRRSPGPTLAPSFESEVIDPRILNTYFSEDNISCISARFNGFYTREDIRQALLRATNMGYHNLEPESHDSIDINRVAIDHLNQNYVAEIARGGRFQWQMSNPPGVFLPNRAATHDVPPGQRLVFARPLGRRPRL